MACGISENISKVLSPDFLSCINDISKNLSSENSLLEESLINFPFSILPIKLKLLRFNEFFASMFSKLILIFLLIMLVNYFLPYH